MAKHYLVIVFLLLLIGISCKKEMPVSSNFELSASNENNTVVLNWTPVSLSGFKSINVYRSVSPIPDPLFNRPIDATLLVGTISDKTITTFRDSNVVMGSGGMVYYKIVLNLENRVVPSNQEELSLDGFSVSYNSPGFNNSGQITTFPEKNLMYIINSNGSSLSVIDYSQKKLIKTVSFSQYGNLFPIMNSGKAELFMMSNYLTISCYDALTLAAKYSISVPSGSIRDFRVQDNYMYVLTVYNNSAKIRTYDLSSQMMVNEKTIYIFSNSTTCNLYIGTQSNKLFFKYYTYLYNSQTGNYTYKNACVKYNIVNHLPGDSVVISHPLMNKDSLSGGSSNYYYIQPSPDGNYITCNNYGDILSLADNSIHNISSGNILNPMVVYPNVGSYLLVKPNNSSGGINFNLMDVYSLPNFNLVTSIKSSNPAIFQGSGSMIKDDFLDNDSLVSYNLKHMFANNQTTSVLTVFFKKIN